MTEKPKTTNNDDVAISVDHIAKTFRLPTESSNSIKQTFINWTRGIKGYREQKVLRDINFEVKKGDFFGIVGRNGSGKSTLLKIISGIYQPTTGSVQINGSLVSFIELGVGFNPELTGRENVYLNGAMLGFSRDEMDKMYEDVVEFAELREFMDQKLKNYSSGMQVRLAFACAIQAKSDILVLDEVLAVGDEAFQRKCSDFFADIKEDKTKTIILVTHDMVSVKKYCNKAILITDGEVKKIGNPDDVANAYSLENFEEVPSSDKQSVDDKKNNTQVANLKISILSKKTLSEKDKLRFQIKYETLKDIETYTAFSLVDMGQKWLYNDNSLNSPCIGKGKFTVEYECDLSQLNDVVLKLIVSVRNIHDEPLLFSSFSESPTLSILRTDIKTKSDRDSATGLIHKNGKWIVLNK